ncbi:MAG: SIMPL domain-containing protein [Oribacterium sp.]|nr:SIMPL domain-containing protein [Oribacterium sp.]MBP3804291.1 SIMPL domain-containing protein [Oribacterium sp.]MBR1856326.1 SIMPL domain-containing protein [Oribacterium sp.]
MRKFRTTFYAGLAALTLTSAFLTGCGETSVPVAAVPSSDTANVSVAEENNSKASLSTTENEATVTVSSVGKVTVIPDMAEISFGIDTEDADVKIAQSRNSSEAQKVVDKLKELGIDEKSIKTTYYDIYPQYDYDDYGDSRITGYNVSTTLTVSDIKVSDAGNIISQCVDAGVNNMNGISYSYSAYDDVYGEALTEAIKEAGEKAEIIAAASGKSLGRIISITEGYQDSYLQYRDSKSVYSNSVEEADAVIMPGESDVEANVTIVYALN